MKQHGMLTIKALREDIAKARKGKKVILWFVFIHDRPDTMQPISIRLSRRAQLTRDLIDGYTLEGFKGVSVRDRFETDDILHWDRGEDGFFHNFWDCWAFARRIIASRGHNDDE